MSEERDECTGCGLFSSHEEMARRKEEDGITTTLVCPKCGESDFYVADE